MGLLMTDTTPLIVKYSTTHQLVQWVMDVSHAQFFLDRTTYLISRGLQLVAHYFTTWHSSHDTCALVWRCTTWWLLCMICMVWSFVVHNLLWHDSLDTKITLARPTKIKYNTNFISIQPKHINSFKIK